MSTLAFIYKALPGFVIASDYTTDGIHYGYDIVVEPHGKGFKDVSGIAQFKLIQSEPLFLKFRATIRQLPKLYISDVVTGGYWYRSPYDESIASGDPVMDVQLRVYTRSKKISLSLRLLKRPCISPAVVYVVQCLSPISIRAIHKLVRS